MAIIESTIPPPLPDETGWPGDPEKNLSAARVESAQLASPMASKMEKNDLGSGGSWSILQWSWIPNSALYDYWFRGRPARRMWQKKEFAIRCNFDASCAEMWVGDLGYVEIEESVCCCPSLPPLTTPTLKGVADVVTFLRWEEVNGKIPGIVTVKCPRFGQGRPGFPRSPEDGDRWGFWVFRRWTVHVHGSGRL